jgi:nitrous oxidase accessory protein NosD
LSYSEQELLRDKNGKPIPQVFDAATGTLIPLTTDMLDDSGSGPGGSNGEWFKVISTTIETPEFTDKYLLNDLTNFPDKGVSLPKLNDDVISAINNLSDGSVTLVKLNQEVIDYIGENQGGGSSPGGVANNEYSTPEVFGAKADGINDDTLAIQQAINDKLEVRLYGNHYKISDTLYTRNGTRLIFGDKTIIERTGSRKFIMNSNPADIIGYEYNKGSLTVMGGIFRNSNANNSLISLCHGDGILFERVTFLNTIDSHTLDIGGCRNVIIRDCQFKGYQLTQAAADSGANFREAIQIDLATSFGLPDSHSSHDSTPCENVLIENCFFGRNPDEISFNKGFQVAIGTHTQVIGRKSKNITIKNNVMEDIQLYGIQVVGMDNVLIENNIIQSNGIARYGVYIRVLSTPYTLEGVKISSDPTQATPINNIRVRGNRITGMSRNGIRVNNLPNTIISTTEKTINPSTPSGSDNMRVIDLAAEGNIIESCGNEGIYATDINSATLERNKVRDCNSEGIFCSYINDATITNNYIQSVGKSGVEYSGRGILIVYSEDVTINENKILMSSYDNIGVDRCNSVVVSNNKCGLAGYGGTFGVGIHIRTVVGFTVSGNVITDAMCHGLDIRIVSKYGVIQGNTINRCGTRGTVASNYGFYVNDNTEEIMIMNNLIYTATGDYVKYAVYSTGSCVRTRSFNNHTTGDDIVPTRLSAPSEGEGPTFDGFVISNDSGTEMYRLTVSSTGQLILTPTVETTNLPITFTGA